MQELKKKILRYLYNCGDSYKTINEVMDFLAVGKKMAIRDALRALNRWNYINKTKNEKGKVCYRFAFDSKFRKASLKKRGII